MEITYHIYDPSGNITALVGGDAFTPAERKTINDAIMAAHPEVEQVGFLAEGSPALTMAGGEFCGNATRSAVLAYLLELDGSASGGFRTGSSDVSMHIRTCGKDINGGVADMPASAPCETEVWCRIPVAGYQICQLDEETIRVDLDGISFLIKEPPVLERLESQFDADSREAGLKAEAGRLLSESGIDNDALGVIFKKVPGGEASGSTAGAGHVEIVPAIWVKAVDTMFLENACGSGSIAASLAEAFAGRPAREYTIMQPSGRPLIITHEKDNAGAVQAAHFRGPVRCDGVTYTLQL